MALLKILNETASALNDRLHRCADYIAKGEAIDMLYADMFETMRGAKGIGLAATQVNNFQRIFVMNTKLLMNLSNGTDIKNSSVTMSELGNVFINPNITKFSKEKTSMNEGCLSVSGTADNMDATHVISRPAIIEAEYFDKNWQPQTFTLSGLTAKCFQHEYDHLDGITLLNRIEQE